MTTYGSRNRLKHTEFTDIADFLRCQDLQSSSFKEVKAVASAFIGKPLTESTIREILTTYKIKYKTLAMSASTKPAQLTAWQVRMEAKLDTIMAQVQMLLDAATQP